MKSLHNTDVNGASKNVADLTTFGNGDTFRLIAKASSEAEGWMKSTKAMQIDGAGCVVQVTTQQRNPDGSYSIAEALTYVWGVEIEETLGDSPNGPVCIGRRLRTTHPVPHTVSGA